MSLAAHLSTLQEKKSELKEEIHQAYVHHDPDTKVATLKKQRLRVQDEIRRLSGKRPQETA